MTPTPTPPQLLAPKLLGAGPPAHHRPRPPDHLTTANLTERVPTRFASTANDITPAAGPLPERELLSAGPVAPLPPAHHRSRTTGPVATTRTRLASIANEITPAAVRLPRDHRRSRTPRRLTTANLIERARTRLAKTANDTIPATAARTSREELLRAPAAARELGAAS